MVRNHHTPPSPDPAGSGTESKVTHPFSPSPEPWELNDLSKYSLSVCKPGPTGHQLLLAEFPLFTLSVLADLLPAKETHSNARLFMAAPRMLRALRAISEVVSTTPIPEFDSDSRVNTLLELIHGWTDGINDLLRELEGGAL